MKKPVEMTSQMRRYLTAPSARLCAWVLVLIGAGVCLWMAPVFRTPQTAVLVLFALGRVRARTG